MSTLAWRLAALAAALSSVTTVLLWLLPRLYEAPQTFEESLLLHENVIYLTRLWVNFIHVLIALVAYSAAAVLLWRRSPALAALGLLFFVLWGFVELAGVSTNIFAVNYTWRAQFPASPPDVQMQLKTLLLGFQAVWDALFFLLLVGFLLGTSCFGLAALKGPGLERWVGVLFLLAAPLTIAIMLGGYTSFTYLDPVTAWLYPVLQPVSRAALAAWLWRAGAGSRPGMSDRA